jgi:4-hydroxy 2-oxovalerate aldolase
VIKLLDCTLRDGGYVNEWGFGEDAIHDIKVSVEKSGVEIIEVGFLKDVKYDPNRALFPGVEWADHVIFPKKEGVTYCLMVDAPLPFPIDKILEKEKYGIDAIRIIVWREKVKECVEYSKKLIEKGYQVFIQPARTSQYTKLEFAELIDSFSEIGITAFYVVDSWGTQDSISILNYAHFAELCLGTRIELGYHGHNHKQQAFACAEKILEVHEDIILDCSIFGMGRDAGNLNTELIMAHLNNRYNKRYNIKPILNVYSKHIKKQYDEFGWGYSIEHFITAMFNCNTRYINYITNNTTLTMDKVYEIFERMTEKQRIDYSETLIKELINDTRS